MMCLVEFNCPKPVIVETRYALLQTEHSELNLEVFQKVFKRERVGHRSCIYLSETFSHNKTFIDYSW